MGSKKNIKTFSVHSVFFLIAALSQPDSDLCAGGLKPSLLLIFIPAFVYNRISLLL